MQTLITSGVEVKVETFYEEDHSKPALNEFTYSYRITLFNHNTFTVQLLRRIWIISDANRDIKTVEGEGVVGRQPILYPGDSYQYVSGCNLPTPIGKMEGLYIFDNKVSGKEFEVKIPVFRLIAPVVLN
jgi:ApaG protein